MMEVYHGSYLQVESPDVTKGRRGLDFGKGFYITDIREQANRWAKRVAIQEGTNAVLNIYAFDNEKAQKLFKYKKFPYYDREWLHFIVENRQGVKQSRETFDIVEGGVANDRVIDTIEAFISGMATEEYVLGQLSLHQPNNQICIINQEVIEQCLVYKESLIL